MQAQIISAGEVVNVIVVPAEATVTAGGASIVWGEGESAIAIDAPEGCTFMMQDGAAMGWRLLDGVLVPPAAPIITASPEELIAFANAAQWRCATGGYQMTIAGETIAFPTSDVAMSTIAGKAARLGQPGAPASVIWQVGPTDFKEIAAADFIAASIEIADFVQATFDALPPIFAGIADGTITTTAQIDAAFG